MIRPNPFLHPKKPLKKIPKMLFPIYSQVFEKEKKKISYVQRMGPKAQLLSQTFFSQSFVQGVMGD